VILIVGHVKRAWARKLRKTERNRLQPSAW
jgi:hypothetical protein